MGMQFPIQLNIPQGARTIDGYGTDGFTIAGTLIAGHVLIYKDACSQITFPDIADMNADSFAPVFALSPRPNMLLFGTGATHRFVPPAMRQYFKQQGIGLETMDSGAAVRTYNILLAEGRDVAALVIKP